MDELRRMAVFATVVEHGSMSGAARALLMSTSAVSQQVRQLERDNGVTLLHRTTRKITLSAAGEPYYAHCAAMLASARRAQQQLSTSHDTPTGQLRLSAPIGLVPHIAPALQEVLGAYPGLTLRLFIDDAFIDLVEARVDLAIRFGALADSSMVARRLCRLECLLCAAPSCLAAQSPIKGPEDLLLRQWLGFTDERNQLQIELVGPSGENRTLNFEARIGSNNQLSIAQMCIAGQGLARLVRIDVASELETGRLVSVLPEWKHPSLDVWAVTPQRDAQPAKVRVAIEALQSYLTKLPGI